MKRKQLFKTTLIMTPILILFFTLYLEVKSIPTELYVKNLDKIKINNLFTVEKTTPVNTSNIVNRKTHVKLLGMLPVKEVNVNEISNLEVYPGGVPIGIKMNTKGLLIIAFSDIKNADNTNIDNPGVLAGLNVGDIILKADNEQLSTSSELIKIINDKKGESIKLSIDRCGEIFEKELKPVKIDEEDRYKIGLWLRDSTAGVGTLTFYDENSKHYGALGHPITDIDTNSLLKVGKGSIVESSIISVKKGQRGNPGELKGIFVNEKKELGDIKNNTECGIFGISNNNLKNLINTKPMKIALKNEIKEGPAQIITTIDENGPKYYDIVIEKLLSQDSPGTKSMVIKVTDATLLEKTGGIVQGMSGSPIIQDNKIIGAVTHVLINKPDTGYGIYIEWMIRDSNILSK
ncbi:SpoIVB peptidase [Clostridium frigidicarnis]|uniref:Stage IV sporulation protein B n=1 Tax=Clostridium frigidicarnis TaxID=84698 RepID=A0A1I0WFX7_9CLOT|nr:SpoIVB peptidase [Clostridium frigidicarnis]SFA87551.1 stage IV sporulation protein B [Clostridium frigidicarnis]